MLEHQIKLGRHGITGFQFLAWTQPMVYSWKRGNKFLYIGCSEHGMCRIFGNGHHVIKRDQIRRDDFFVFRFYDSIREARNMEANLISKHSPVYNK